MTLKDLHFQHPDGGVRFFMTCNNCGKKVAMTRETYIADFPIDKSHHVSFFTCGVECLAQFHSVTRRSAVTKYISSVLLKAAYHAFDGRPRELEAFMIEHDLIIPSTPKK